MSTPEKRAVTPEAVQQIAGITGLDMDMARAAQLTPEVQSLRDGIDAMREVDLTDIEPATIYPLKRI